MNRPREAQAQPGELAPDEDVAAWEEQLAERANLDRLLVKHQPHIKRDMPVELAANGSNYAKWRAAVMVLTRPLRTQLLYDEDGQAWREDARLSKLLEYWSDGREDLDVSRTTERYLDAVLVTSVAEPLQRWLDQFDDVRDAWGTLQQRFQGHRGQQLARAVLDVGNCRRNAYGSDLEYVQSCGQKRNASATLCQTRSRLPN